MIKYPLSCHDLTSKKNRQFKILQICNLFCRYLTTSTAPSLTLTSLALIDMLAANEPSTLNTTASVCGGTTTRLQSAVVWSPLE